MPNAFKTVAIASCIAALLLSCQNTAGTSQSNNNDFLPRDTSRNVLSFADALAPALPSVVRIGRLSQNAEGQLGLGGLGSGAIIDAENGYIITNAHVVENGAGYLVNVPDGRVLKAKLIGIDTPTDIAVLQADDLRVGAVTLANSDQLRVGDVVFAVGYPLGLEQSLSLGVISGLGRTNSAEGLQDFIQTDAAINSGNSGGPLLDSQGRLIGINTAILSKSGGSNGIGFSVPIALATQVTDQLIRYGSVHRGFIGIEATRVSEEASEIVGIDHWDGAYITAISPGSAAQQAGLQQGDVITKFDGKTVKTPNGLRAWIGVAETDSVHSLSYIRKDGIEHKVQVKVGTQKQAFIASLGQLGATIRPLRPSDNQDPHVRGVYVKSIEPDSAAERAGLIVGDVIGGINNEPTETMAQSDDAMSVSKGRARLLVYRYGVAIPLFIEQ